MSLDPCNSPKLNAPKMRLLKISLLSTVLTLNSAFGAGCDPYQSMPRTQPYINATHAELALARRVAEQAGIPNASKFDYIGEALQAISQ